MKLIFDCRALDLYPLSQPGFHGGTETMVLRLVQGLSATHTVHVIANDLPVDEQRGPREFWWTRANFPRNADALVAVHNLEGLESGDFHADKLILASNGVDPFLGPNGAWAAGVDAYPVFSQCHADLLCRQNPQIDPKKTILTGLGIDLHEYASVDAGDKDPGNFWAGNDPARYLWHLLDIFDAVRREITGASLTITYDFDQRFERTKWAADALADMLWECKQRMERTPGIQLLGSVSREQLIAHQGRAAMHVYASDPPNVGSQIHGISQMEAAAAGCALVLNNFEAFPEVFGKAALILPTPGTFRPELERRFDAQDWADNVAAILLDAPRLAEMQKQSRALAKKHTWGHVVKRWNAMLEAL